MRRARQALEAIAAAAALVAISAAAAAVFVQPAKAGELYLKGGAPGAILGYAQPLGPHFGLRVDVASIGTVSERRTEDGINYDSRLKLDRAALLADWFPFGGSFRFSGGLTSNKYALDLAASGAGGSITVGSTRYVTTSADQFKVQIKLPSSMPYFGFGWGHHSEAGLRFSFDLGASFGKASLNH
jgi:opacity protein-like surface antigen